MGRKLKNINLFVAEDGGNSPENSVGSPRAAVFKVASTCSFKRSKRGVQKRVVSVPMKDVDRVTGPPPDSWAWRKYGQKPIKGSPYPRGYYRCSSSKGCPARKQVERSKLDPTILTVTYSGDHNHPLPASRSNRHRTPVINQTATSRNPTKSWPISPADPSSAENSGGSPTSKRRRLAPSSKPRFRRRTAG